MQGEARSISKPAEIPMLNFLLKGCFFLKDANTQFVKGKGLYQGVKWTAA